MTAEASNLVLMGGETHLHESLYTSQTDNRDFTRYMGENAAFYDIQRTESSETYIPTRHGIARIDHSNGGNGTEKGE